MSSYAQITIHSQKSKMNQTKGELNRGRIIKGSRLSMGHGYGHGKKAQEKGEKQIMKNGFIGRNQIVSNEQTREKIRIKDQIYDTAQLGSSENIYEAIRAEPRPSTVDQSSFESTVYPSIYFKKTTMRSVLKQFVFPSNCQALPPSDQRAPLIYQIIANLFSEITIYIFNILIAEDPFTHSYFTFFSDTEIVPFTKCCNAPVYIEMKHSSTGKILCNGKNCPHPSLAQFLINFEDGKKIWRDLTYLNSAPMKDAFMKDQIAKYIQNGRFRSFKLKHIINETSKQVEQEFYSQKKENMTQNQNNDTFLTNVKSKAYNSQKKMNSLLNEEEATELVSLDDKSVESLKIKIQFMTKRQKGLKNKLARSIIDDGKVFHKQFDMSEKIDEIMRKTKHSGNSTYLSFPRLMDQMRTQQRKKHQSFTKQINTQH